MSSLSQIFAKYGSSLATPVQTGNAIVAAFALSLVAIALSTTSKPAQPQIKPALVSSSLSNGDYLTTGPVKPGLLIVSSEIQRKAALNDVCGPSERFIMRGDGTVISYAYLVDTTVDKQVPNTGYFTFNEYQRMAAADPTTKIADVTDGKSQTVFIDETGRPNKFGKKIKYSTECG